MNPKTILSRLKQGLVLFFSASLVFANFSAYAGDIVTYIHTDRLGNPVAKTNSVGAVIWRQSYTPYGEADRQSEQDGPGYTGHRYDASTSLVYMQARYYDPKIGRFLSVDPITFAPNQPQHFNRYWYGNGNPYKYTDPTGKDGWNFVFNPTMTPQQMQNYAQVSAARDRVNAVANDPELNYQARQAFGNGAAGELSAASLAFPPLAEFTEPAAIIVGGLTILDKWNHEGLDSNDWMEAGLTLFPAGKIAKSYKASKTTLKLIETNTRLTGVLTGTAGAVQAANKSDEKKTSKSIDPSIYTGLPPLPKRGKAGPDIVF